MLPGHCKDVAVKDVDFSLTKENIDKAIEGKKAYTRCDHYVLRNEEDLAVVRVVKEESKELFRRIVEHEVVSLPDTTVFFRDDSVDVINAPSMARIAQRFPGMTVVVQGSFNHVSFIGPTEVLELMVVDVVPPSPSKLSVLVERALVSGLVDLPVIPSYHKIDLNDMVKEVNTEGVLFPCQASGLEAPGKVYYLDQMPTISGEVTMIGCDLSARIYRTLYKEDMPRIEMCPQELAKHNGKKCLVKCCKVREGFQIRDGMAIVPWGATVLEVAGAINALFSPP